MPGAQAYCDPDSADDDNDGFPDDLLQVASELSCNWAAYGLTNVNQAPSTAGDLFLLSAEVTDDGTADFFCTSGDPDPNNDPILPEPCPQETPVQPDNDAYCDTPGMPGSGVCGPVPDGVPDPGETTGVRLKLRNDSVSRQDGSPRDLTNLTVGIRGITPSVGCVKTGQVFVGDLAAGAAVTTPAGALSFVIDPAEPGPGQSGATTWATAGFAVTAQADDMEGIDPSRTFDITIDLDRFDAPLIPPSCSDRPAVNGPGVLCEGFDTDRNASGTYDVTRLPVGVDPNDALRAIGDPNDDVLGYTQGTGAGPAGTSAVTCADDAARGYATCNPVAEENDWHLHSPTEGPGAGYDPLHPPAIGAPDGGKAHGGTRSMHMGRHLSASTTLSDTVRFRQVSAFVLDSQGDPNIPGLALGPASTVDFWQIIAVPDDENFGSGFIPDGTTFAGGQVQLSLLGSNGRFEKWQRLTPSFDYYDSIDQGSVSLCGFDPGDDEFFPTDETMCSPARMFAEKGDAIGTDPTCTVDTNGNDPLHKDCGDIICTPGSGCTETGSLGAGVWTRSEFDLSPFAGRVARLRWIGMVEGGWSFGVSRSALESPTGVSYQYFEGDDGWWIDDIRLTDLRVQPGVITPDSATGLSQCLTGLDAGNCGVVDIRIAGALDLGGPLVLNADVQRQTVTLDARTTVAGDDPATAGITEGACDFGVLQYRFSECLDPDCVTSTVMQPYSPAPTLAVSPAQNTSYKVEARCTSDTACEAARVVAVNVYTGTEFDDPDTALYPPCSVTTGSVIPGPPGVAKYTDIPGEGGVCAAGACSAGYGFLRNQPCATGPAGDFFCSGALEFVDSQTLRWPTRPRPNGWGYNVWRYDSAGTTTGVDLFPEASGGTGVATFAGAMLFSNVHPGPVLPILVTQQDTDTPPPGRVFFYQVAPYHQPVWPSHDGIRPSSSSRATVCVAAP